MSTKSPHNFVVEIAMEKYENVNYFGLRYYSPGYSIRNM